MELSKKRLNKIIKIYNLATKPYSDSKYTDGSKSYWYCLDIKFRHFAFAKIFKIELNNYGDQEIIYFFIRTPAYEFINTPLKMLDFKSYLFNALKMNKIEMLSTEDVQDLTNIDGYINYKDKQIHKRGVREFTSYCYICLLNNFLK